MTVPIMRLRIRWRWVTGRSISVRSVRKYFRNLEADVRAYVYIRSQRGLREVIHLGAECIETMGMSLPQLAQLHRVARAKSGDVLEFGSGLSTLVLAHAISGTRILDSSRHLTSLEQSDAYSLQVEKALSEVGLASHASVRVVRVVPDTAQGNNHWRFESHPEGSFGLILVDGPAMPRDQDGGSGVGVDIRAVLDGRRLMPGGVVLVDNRVETRIFIAEKVPELAHEGASIRDPLHRYAFWRHHTANS